jgi:hypothetical protein
VEVPACCPHCDDPLSWELIFHVSEEIGFAAPHAPAFLFRCATCMGLVRVSFHWALEAGADPRPLRLVDKTNTAAPLLPRIILVDDCPLGCGARLGLQLDPEDPTLGGKAWPDETLILGGYRCPKCDGEGRLALRPLVEAVMESGNT